MKDRLTHIEWPTAVPSAAIVATRVCGQLTPLSPSLPAAMPPVLEAIPQLPITPPVSECDLDAESEAVLASAVHVLSTEAMALSCLARLYQTDPAARRGFAAAVETVVAAASRGGKLVVCGVGKSGKIGEKLVATLNSLGVVSVFLHPVEALHGDLGMIRPVSLALSLSLSLILISYIYSQPLPPHFLAVRFLIISKTCIRFLD